MFAPPALEQPVFRAVHRHAAVEPDGLPARGPGAAYAEAADILSDATPIGSLQVPRSGQPILLMADRQTTGGYPKIATVITADLPLAGQLAPGDWIRFVPCTRDGARSTRCKRLERRLAGSVRVTGVRQRRSRDRFGDRVRASTRRSRR